MGLGEEFDLADSAAAALEVVTGADRLPNGVVVADARGEAADLGDRAEIEAAAPDEGADGIKEGLPGCDISRGGAGADEGGAFPGKGTRFVVRYRGDEGES